jgi:hypothetical protein
MSEFVRMTRAVIRRPEKQKEKKKVVKSIEVKIYIEVEA